MNEKLHDYVLGELPAAERGAFEQALAADSGLAMEAERLAMVHAALRRLPEEEPARRIAFVSDKVFEPKWYQTWWNSGARLVFAGLTMLAVAVAAHGVLAKPVTPAPAGNIEALVQARLDQEITRRLEPAIAQAVANSEARTQRVVQTALSEAGKKHALDRQALLVSMEENYIQLRKTMGRLLKEQMSVASLGGGQ